MSASLIDDVLSVWDAGVHRARDLPVRRRPALSSADIVERLRELNPKVYGTWDATMFGRAMRTAGAPTKKIRIGIYSVRGVTLDSIKRMRPVHSELVYFIERDGFVKIGTTRNLPGRMAALNRGDSAIFGMTINPVSVLATMPGGRHVEQAIHQLFAHLRYDGEWFLFDGALVPFVKAIAEANPQL